MEFSIEKKGYSISEVDSYVEQLQIRCQRLQAQNAELEQKLATAKRLIRRFSDTENALKQNIADSKRAAAYMISDARDRSDELLDSARESCGEIISDLDLRIGERMNTVDLLKAEVAAFKEEIFGLYSTHIELIDKLAFAAENFEYQPDYTPIAEAVDKFEEADAAVCDIPEFVDYPEESIFAEIEEAEKAQPEEDFVIDNEEIAEEDDQISFETEIEAEAVDAAEAEDMSLMFETVEDAEGDEDSDIIIAAEDFDDIPDFDFSEFEDDDDEIEDAEEADALETKTEETDYFKFLADFANSDDGADA